MKQAIAILTSPTGKRFYEAYGPLVTVKRKAMRFINEDIALGAALNRMGRGDRGFWRSERDHVKRAEQEYRGWTATTEEV